MIFLQKKSSFLINVLLATFIISALLFFLETPAALAEQAVVKEDVVNLRSAPTTASSIVGRAVQGERMDFLASQGGWCRVRKNGVECWVAGWLVDVIKDPADQVAVSSGGAVVSLVETTADIVNIRGGPGTNYIVMEKSFMGDRYEYLEKSENWYKIKLFNGTGWISAQYSRVVKAAAGGQAAVPGPESDNVVIKESDVNVRSGPGTVYSIISRANKGDKYSFLEQSADWYKIKLSNGSTGWVAAWLANLDKAAEPHDVPFVPPPVSRGSESHVATVTPTEANKTVTPADENKTDDATGKNTADTTNTSTTTTANTTGPAVLKSVEAKAEGINTVLTVRSNGLSLNHSISTLNNPDRLVVDINGLEPGTGVPGQLSYSSQLVDGVRVALNSKNPVVTRIVIDLKNVCTYEKKLLNNNTVLVLTIKPRLSVPISGARIVLDPGHGGSDPGAIGPSGLKEKDVNLDIALKTAEYLKSKGAIVILTRSGDSTVDLYSRPEFAVKNKAALFVSIHSNSNPSINYGGTSTYYMRTPAEGKEHLKLEGMYLAKAIQNSLLGDLKLDDRGLKQADYVVLVKNMVPAALVEVAYLSYRPEEKLLADPSFRSKAAIAIGKGIEAYLSGK